MRCCGKKTVNEDHLFIYIIFLPIFHCIICVIIHQSHDHNDGIFILAGKFLHDYI